MLLLIRKLPDVLIRRFLPGARCYRRGLVDIEVVIRKCIVVRARRCSRFSHRFVGVAAKFISVLTDLNFEKIEEMLESGAIALERVAGSTVGQLLIHFRQRRSECEDHHGIVRQPSLHRLSFDDGLPMLLTCDLEVVGMPLDEPRQPLSIIRQGRIHTDHIRCGR